MQEKEKQETLSKLDETFSSYEKSFMEITHSDDELLEESQEFEQNDDSVVESNENTERHRNEAILISNDQQSIYLENIAKLENEVSQNKLLSAIWISLLL